MGAGPEELWLTEMPVDRAIGQIDEMNNNSPQPDGAKQRSPMGNGWTGTSSICPHTSAAGERSDSR